MYLDNNHLKFIKKAGLISILGASLFTAGYLFRGDNSPAPTSIEEKLKYHITYETEATDFGSGHKLVEDWITQKEYDSLRERKDVHIFDCSRL